MLKAVIIFVVFVTISVFLVFQVILPLFVKDLPLFWWFKPLTKGELLNEFKDLNDLEKDVDATMQAYSDVTEKVDAALEQTMKLKEKTNTNNQ